MKCAGVITWGEFADYLVDKASVLNKNVFSCGADSIKQYGFTQTLSMSSMNTQNKKPYQINESSQKSVYIPSLNKLALVQDKKDTILFINPQVLN
jgi:hypothetical protein